MSSCLGTLAYRYLKSLIKKAYRTGKNAEITVEKLDNLYIATKRQDTLPMIMFIQELRLQKQNICMVQETKTIPFACNEQHLKIFYRNIRRIRNKFHLVEALPEEEDIAIICLTETWITEAKKNC